MTSADAYARAPDQRYRVRSWEDRQRAFLVATRHSRHVRVLRKVLPGVAVLVLAGYFLSSQLSVTFDGVTASVDSVQISGSSLRMMKPKLKGVDKTNGDYVITADYADQDVKNTKIIALHNMKTDMSQKGGGWSHLDAARGVFDSDAQMLLMKDDIRIKSSSGMTGHMILATLDMKTKTLRSHLPVHFEMTSGTVHASGMTMHSGEHLIIFRGHVHVHLDRAQPTPANKSAPAKPQAKPAPPAPAPVADNGAAEEKALMEGHYTPPSDEAASSGGAQ